MVTTVTTDVTPVNVSFLGPGQGPDVCGQKGYWGLRPRLHVEEQRGFAGFWLSWQRVSKARQTRNGTFHTAACLVSLLLRVAPWLPWSSEILPFTGLLLHSKILKFTFYDCQKDGWMQSRLDYSHFFLPIFKSNENISSPKLLWSLWSPEGPSCLCDTPSICAWLGCRKAKSLPEGIILHAKVFLPKLGHDCLQSRTCLH